MSFEEAMGWGQYRKKHGPFTVQSRVEYGFALLAAIQTGEKDLTKFIPWHVEPEATPEGVEAILKSLSRGKKNGVAEPGHSHS
jgi:hypothetical protein